VVAGHEHGGKLPLMLMMPLMLPPLDLRPSMVLHLLLRLAHCMLIHLPLHEL
jgi:hypothetical protein